MRWVVLLVALSSCKGEWITEVERAPFKVRQKVECEKPGICYTCDWDLAQGQYNCGVKVSLSCPGQKWVMYEVTPYEGYYENEPNEYLKKTRERRVQDLTECE